MPADATWILDESSRQRKVKVRGLYWRRNALPEPDMSYPDPEP